MIPTKMQKKEILKATCASKKAKFINDFTVAEATQIILMRNQWLMSNSKSNFGLKTWLKKRKKSSKSIKIKLTKFAKKQKNKPKLMIFVNLL